VASSQVHHKPRGSFEKRIKLRGGGVGWLPARRPLPLLLCSCSASAPALLLLLLCFCSCSASALLYPPPPLTAPPTVLLLNRRSGTADPRLLISRKIFSIRKPADRYWLLGASQGLGLLGAGFLAGWGRNLIRFSKDLRRLVVYL
jgi:hypothetical protein